MSIRGIGQLNGKLAKLQTALTRTIPRRIGQDAEDHFRRSFKNQGFTDRGLVKWAPVKNKKAMKGRVLSRTGMLYNSVQLVQADANGIRVVAGGRAVPYAKIHNEGGTIQRQVSVRAHHRKEHFANTRRGRVKRKAATVRRHQMRMNLHLRKRQFMGKSHVLDMKMRKTILTTIGQVMNTR